MTFMTLLLLIVAAVVGSALLAGIRIVPQAKVLVVERLGKSTVAPRGRPGSSQRSPQSVESLLCQSSPQVQVRIHGVCKRQLSLSQSSGARAPRASGVRASCTQLRRLFPPPLAARRGGRCPVLRPASKTTPRPPGPASAARS